MKLKSILVFALMLLLSVSAVGKIRVMSYNIRQGVAEDGNHNWDIRKPATIAMIKDLKPDVFGMQEAFKFQLDYIAENCPEYAIVGVGRDDGKEGGEHMSVAYNTKTVELLDWGTYWLSETPEVPSKGWDAACKRTATWTLLREKKSGKKFFFVNTHLDHVGVVARKEGLALLYRRISEMNPDGAPMVLTGDFNVLPNDKGLVDINRIMSSARFSAKKADTKGSFNGWGEYGESKAAPVLGRKVRECLPIDYIYFTGYKKCSVFKVVDNSYVNIPYISDHYPVYADLK